MNGKRIAFARRMKKLFAVIVLTVIPGAVVAQSASPRPHTHDYHPNPAFHPIRLEATGTPGKIEQVGEVVILEGDSSLVSADGMGNYGLADMNLSAITNRFYTQYSDDFAELIVFTTFDDSQAQGALAYESSTKSDVSGIGQDPFDDSASYGSKTGKLYAFVNMMRWSQYQDMDGVPITDPKSSFYSTLGQEFAHRWLAFLQYKNAAGQSSTAMLGRDMAHWGSTLQAFGSMMDGNDLGDKMDGSFVVKDFMTRYSPLDMYAMGLIGPEDVPPFFVVDNATTTKGGKINPANGVAVGSTMKGTREDITIDQVVAAMGPRTPAFDAAPHDFRVAYVLVTKPGERAADVLGAAQQIDQARKVWESSFVEFTAKHGTMCTQSSAPCGAALADIIGGSVSEAGGNGNGVPEPGEPVSIQFTLANGGPVDAKNVQVSASGDLVTTAEQLSVDLLATATQKNVTFSGSIPADAVCGQAVTVDAQSLVDGNTFRGFTTVIPGLTTALNDTFEADDGGFTVADGSATNGWQWGTPVEYDGLNGWVFQPGGGHTGSKCWFTGLQAGHRAMFDSSLAVGKSQLLMPAVDVSQMYKPTLHYFAWFQAIDFSKPQQGGQPVSNVAMTVEASADGGNSWVTVDTVDQTAASWQERNVVLDGKLPLDQSILVRFTASNPVATDQVEAGVDDFQIMTLTQACNPNAATPPATMPPAQMANGCGCHVGGSTGGAGGAVLVALLLFAIVARRRWA
jgi:MYXO-CTERM domain-containing protein